MRRAAAPPPLLSVAARAAAGCAGPYADGGTAPSAYAKNPAASAAACCALCAGDAVCGHWAYDPSTAATACHLKRGGVTGVT
eukprot:gene10452-6143_t